MRKKSMHVFACLCVDQHVYIYVCVGVFNFCTLLHHIRNTNHLAVATLLHWRVTMCIPPRHFTLHSVPLNKNYAPSNKDYAKSEDKQITLNTKFWLSWRADITMASGFLVSYGISRVRTTRLVQWLSWVSNTQERKKERKKNSPTSHETQGRKDAVLKILLGVSRIWRFSLSPRGGEGRGGEGGEGERGGRGKTYTYTKKYLGDFQDLFPSFETLDFPTLDFPLSPLQRREGTEGEGEEGGGRGNFIQIRAPSFHIFWSIVLSLKNTFYCLILCILTEHARVRMRVRVHVCVYVRLHVPVHVPVCLSMCICVHVWVCACVGLCVYVYYIMVLWLLQLEG